VAGRPRKLLVPIPHKLPQKPHHCGGVRPDLEEWREVPLKAIFGACDAVRASSCRRRHRPQGHTVRRQSLSHPSTCAGRSRGIWAGDPPRVAKRRDRPGPVYLGGPHSSWQRGSLDFATVTASQLDPPPPNSMGCGSSQGAFMRPGGWCCRRSVTGGCAGVRGRGGRSTMCSRGLCRVGSHRGGSCLPRGVVV
jgi:hypothetical protein